MLIQIIITFLFLIIFWLILLPYYKSHKIYAKYKNQSRFYFFPLFGYLSQIQYSKKKYQDALEFIISDKKPNQKFIVTNVFLKPYVIIQDHNMAKQFLLDHYKFQKLTSYFLRQLYFKRNLLTVEGSQWRRQKKILSGAMNYNFFKKIFPTIKQTVQTVVNTIQNKKPIKIYEIMYQVSSQTISHSFFSINLNKLKINDIGLMSTLSKATIQSIKHSFSLSYLIKSRFLSEQASKWGYFLNKKEKGLFDTFTLIKKMLQQEILKRVQQIKITKQIIYYDFLDYYAQVYIQNPSQQLMDQMIQQFFDILSGGSDTTSFLGGYSLYCLAKYPEYYKSLEKIINNLPQNYTLQQICEINQLTYFIKQVGRFFPPIFDLLPRTIRQKTKIGNFQFEKGTLFSLSIKGIMRDTNIFENSSQFKPERWKSEKIPPQSYLVFSYGPRTCIGQKLAMIQVRVMIIQFIRKFKVRLNQKVEPVFILQVVYKLQNEQVIIAQLKQ